MTISCRLPTCSQPAVKDGGYCAQHEAQPPSTSGAASHQVGYINGQPSRPLVEYINNVGGREWGKR